MFVRRLLQTIFLGSLRGFTFGAYLLPTIVPALRALRLYMKLRKHLAVVCNETLGSVVRTAHNMYIDVTVTTSIASKIMRAYMMRCLHAREV